MKRTILTAEQAAWLAATIERNRARFSGWSMEADDDAGDKKDDDTDDGDDAQDADDGGDKKDDEKDWKAEYEAQQRINRNLERRTKRDAAKIRDLEGKKAPAPKKADDAEDKIDADKIREEAKAEAAREALHGRVEDKIEAKAAAFEDPEVAVAVLLRKNDIEDFIDDGKVDVDAIVDALKELGEKQPNLLAQGGKKFKGDPDGGARKESTGRPKTLGDAVSRHYQPRK